jgi:hypothetical protein
MRVSETTDGTGEAVAVPDVRRMRVTRLVGERMVLAVVGDPLMIGPCMVMQPRIPSVTLTGHEPRTPCV